MGTSQGLQAMQETLRLCTIGKVSSLRFGVPMVWRKPKNHHDDFCMEDMTGWNQRKKKKWGYSEIKSARRPVLHCAEVLVLTFSFLLDLTEDETPLEAMEDTDSSCSNYSSSSVAAESSTLSTHPKPFSQGQLNDLVRDLNLSKESSEILASRLGEHGILDSETKITFFSNRDNLLLRFFTMEHEFVYVIVIASQAFLQKMGFPDYNSDEWRLSIDSSKRSLKCVLLHKDNNFACVPIGHSVVAKEQ